MRFNVCMARKGRIVRPARDERCTDSSHTKWSPWGRWKVDFMNDVEDTVPADQSGPAFHQVCPMSVEPRPERKESERSSPNRS